MSSSSTRPLNILELREKEIDDEVVTSLGHEYLKQTSAALGDGTVVTVRQNTGIEETGGAVWDAALVFADWLSRCPELVRGKTVCEIGAGTGFGSCAVQRLGALRAVATDTAHYLELIQGNLDLNCVGRDRVSCAVEHAWGTGLSEELTALGPFDVVFGTDLIYNSELFEPLCMTLVDFVRAGGGGLRVFICQKTRFRPCEEEFFERTLPRFGLRAEKIYALQAKVRHFKPDDEVRLFEIFSEKC